MVSPLYSVAFVILAYHIIAVRKWLERRTPCKRWDWLSDLEHSAHWSIGTVSEEVEDWNPKGPFKFFSLFGINVMFLPSTRALKVDEASMATYLSVQMRLVTL